MFYIVSHSLKRLYREGAKNLSVPFIAFVFVILINVLGGIRVWLEDRYEDTLDNFPIIAVVSDLYATNTDDLEIGMRYIELFIDPDARFSLYDHTGEIAMMRTLEDFEIPGLASEITLKGISSLRADPSLDPEYGVEVVFFEGYDEAALLSDEMYGLISYDLYPLTDNGILKIAVGLQMPEEIIYDERLMMHGNLTNWIYVIEVDGNLVEVDVEDYMTIVPGEIVFANLEIIVIGIFSGAGHGLIYSPFWTVTELAEEYAETEVYTESLSVILNNNRALSDFKETAALSFSRVNPVMGTRPFAMIIHDSEFYETLEPLRQNIIVVDVATPFIYLLSIAVGFLTSVLLTRRRKAELAVMRSIGVNRFIVFMSALTEQTLLSITGAAFGIIFVTIIWGYTSFTRPAVFLGCYLLGAIVAAINAAGTNVMRVLRDKGE